MGRRTEWAGDDELEIEVMAVFSVPGAKMQERSKVLRAGGFDHGEPLP